jgi:transcriptional regulator with XRE-family HTH domain
MPSIKDIVIERYGSINNFIDKNYTKLKTSRTHMYKLLNGENVNPTVETLVELAGLLELPEEVVFREYSTRHRIKRLESQHED